MLSRRTIALPALLAALALAPACGGDDGHGDHEEEVNCAEETRDDTYVANLAKDGERGNLSVVLVESDPGPPAKGDNTWTLQLVDADQQPVDGATVTVTPFMPDHGHGTPIDVEVTPGGGAGMYEAAPVNLWMPGLWEVTVDASTDTVDDSVVFAFCIEG